jgi:hypothetical protein
MALSSIDLEYSNSNFISSLSNFSNENQNTEVKLKLDKNLNLDEELLIKTSFKKLKFVY